MRLKVHLEKIVVVTMQFSCTITMNDVDEESHDNRAIANE